MPEHLGELEGAYASGNPLRLGEPNISMTIQGGTTGDYDTPQKVIQIIGGFGRYRHVKRYLYVLSYANDYAKKLIGKYLIIELRSLFSCFERLVNLIRNIKKYILN